MNGWKEYKLEDVSSLIDYRGKTPTKTTSGVPLITAKIVKNGVIEKPTEFISHEDYPKWMTRGYPKVGDVVMTTEAPLGEVAQLKDNQVALAQRIITLRGHEGILNNGYLKYFLQSEDGQSRLKARETGTTVTGIKQSELKKVLIPLPDLQTQQSIAEILSSLDDKIELNNQINTNLEALAQAIFKQWFIDFEFPDENGNPYKSSGGKMVESEFGEIPCGWEVAGLLDFVSLTGGGTPKTAIPEYWGGDIPWIAAKDVTPSDGTFIISTEKKITTLGLNNSSAKLLKPFSTVITARGTVGNYCLIPSPMAISQSNYAFKSDENFDFYAFLLTSSLIKEMQQKSYGTVFDTITTQTLKSTKFVKPQCLNICAFEGIVSGIYHLILQNSKENCAIKSLRDQLLPKLLSGQISIA